MTNARVAFLSFHLFVAAACASAPTVEGQGPRGTAARDPVDFIVLGRGGSAVDCAARRANVKACRVRDNANISRLRSRLASGGAVWREGDALVFAHQGNATAVDLTGTLDYPMSRVRGTDLWIVKLRIEDIDRALISYAIRPLGDQSSSTTDPEIRVWRGPGAPAEAARAAQLRGRVTADSIVSQALGDVRALLVYTPSGTEPPDGVIYLGDGAAVRRLAPHLDTLITAGSLPRIMLVGLASATESLGGSSRADPRALEYLWNYDTLNTRFLAHERFFLDEVMPWAESHHGAPRTRERRAMFGVSNGAGWALQMGLRNPERFAHVIAFSPGGVRTGHMATGMRMTPPVRFLLLSGSLEPVFDEVTRAWIAALAEKGLEHRVIRLVAGHDWNAWRDHFGAAAQWAFEGAGP